MPEIGEKISREVILGILEEGVVMPRWTEGIAYKVLKGGKVRCLYCERVLDKTELGPHLSICPERKPLFDNKRPHIPPPLGRR